ncbi:MAG: response regulator [Candidatus Cloacimonetes bacterium]|nr:response regulator [Candidatus Cloacimonadota bacterium]
MGKILLAEDDSIMRSMLFDSLEHFGHEVEAAENGEIAWELWNQGSFDLLITDINMPKLNGIDLLKRIRAKNSSFPVIVITGVYLESAENQALGSGASALILKPFKMKDLYEAINKLSLN